MKTKTGLPGTFRWRVVRSPNGRRIATTRIWPRDPILFECDTHGEAMAFIESMERRTRHIDAAFWYAVWIVGVIVGGVLVLGVVR